MDTPRKTRGSPLKALLAGLVLGALGGMAGTYLHLRDQPRGPGSRVDCPDTARTKPANAPEPTKPAKDFNFYGVLEDAPAPPAPRPDLERPPLPPTVGVPPAPAPPARPVFLQLASFRAQADAEALKARIVLAGQTASVVSLDLPGKGTFYRVRVGPFANKEEALQAGTLMHRAGIDPSGAILVH